MKQQSGSRYNYSFTPQGDYFIFEMESGRTIQKGIPDPKTARTFIAVMTEKEERK